MRAEVITIGTELLLGEINDTNATHIAQKLREIGLDLIYRTTVGDNEERIAEVVSQALDRVDVVITTGGLGPTVDDVTRQAVAGATGRELVFRPELFAMIEERFRRFNVRMSENNRQQAYTPEGAEPIENPVGTAPIFVLETERGLVAVLPGVPSEMHYLLQNELVPRLREYVGAPAVIKSRTLRTAGIGESQIDAKIGDMMTAANPTIGLAAHTGQTDIRITAKAGSEQEADEMIAPVEAEIRSRLTRYIYGTGQELLEDVIVAMLKQQGATTACLEVGTHGILSERMRQANEETGILLSCLALDSVSGLETVGLFADQEPGELALAAAQMQREKYNATFGIGLIIRHKTGTKEGGAAIAVVTADDSRVRTFDWTEARTHANVWAATHALAMLRRMLSKTDNDE